MRFRSFVPSTSEHQAQTVKRWDCCSTCPTASSSASSRGHIRRWATRKAHPEWRETCRCPACCTGQAGETPDRMQEAPQANLRDRFAVPPGCSFGWKSEQRRIRNDQSFSSSAEYFAWENPQIETISSIVLIGLMNEHLGPGWPRAIERLVIESERTNQGLPKIVSQCL